MTQDEKDRAIKTIEETISPRRIREAILGLDNGWLKDRDDEITALRNQT